MKRYHEAINDRSKFEDENILVKWWEKDGAWHFAARDLRSSSSRKSDDKFWQAPDDANYGGYDTREEAISAARRHLKTC